jgi:uncharacterized membrane protein YagU involved in acid resistance
VILLHNIGIASRDDLESTVYKDASQQLSRFQIVIHIKNSCLRSLSYCVRPPRVVYLLLEASKAS